MRMMIDELLKDKEKLKKNYLAVRENKLWKECVTLSLDDRLVFALKRDSFNKVNSIKDRRCFYALLILFLLYCKRSLREYQG